MNALGEHMLLEYYRCDPAKLAQSDAIKELIVNAVRSAHGTVVTNVFHNFSPHGVSGVVVIAESHVTVHTWPEHACAAVDIFSCSARLDKELIRDLLQQGFAAEEVATRIFERGELGKLDRPGASLNPATHPQPIAPEQINLVHLERAH